jgi:hypothetical protein
MNTTSPERLVPPPLPEGLAWFPVEEPDWRPAPEGARCFHGSGRRTACGQPAEAGHPRQGGAGLASNVSFCREHLHARLLWVEDGKVWRWEKRNADGSPVPSRGWCRAHRMDRSQCPPSARHEVAVRLTDAQWEELRVRAAKAGLSRDDGIGRALAAWLAIPDAGLRGRLPGRRKRGADGSRKVRTPLCEDRIKEQVTGKAARLGISFADAVMMASGMWEPPAAPASDPAEVGELRAKLEKATGMLAEWYRDAPHVKLRPQPAPPAMAVPFKSHEDEEVKTTWR